MMGNSNVSNMKSATRYAAGCLLLALAACDGKPAAAPSAITPMPAETAATPATDDIASARAFLARIYAGYYPDASLETLLPGDEVYAPAFVAALDANQQVHPGEVPYLQGDPLCDCQDVAEDLRELAFDIVPHGRDELLASATGSNAEHPFQVQLTLQRHGDSWRVADVATPTEPSLLRAIVRDTEQVKRQQ